MDLARLLRNCPEELRPLLEQSFALHKEQLLHALGRPLAFTPIHRSGRTKTDETSEKIERIKAERKRAWEKSGAQKRPENVGKEKYEVN